MTSDVEISERERYFEKYEEFKTLLDVALSIWHAIPALTKGDVGQNYANIIFTKIIGHALSLNKLLPASEEREDYTWDLSSCAALARCIIESFDALAYIAIHDMDLVEREFRFLLWRAHDYSRRIKISQTLNYTEDFCSIWKPKLDGAKADLEASAGMLRLEENLQKRILKELPEYHLTQKERNAASKIDHNFYTNALMFLSQHVHTQSFAIHQLSGFIPNTEEGFRQIGIPLTHTIVFMAKSISGMIYTFKISPLSFSESERVIISMYEDISRCFDLTSDIELD